MAVHDNSRGSETPVPSLSILRTLLESMIVGLTEQRSLVITAAMALAHQNADGDADLARVLHEEVAPEITALIDHFTDVLNSTTQPAAGFES